MNVSMPSTLPRVHREFLERLVRRVSPEPWLVGVAAMGSFATDTMDEFSDLDVIMAIEPSEYPNVLSRARAIVASFGNLLTAFTGEHVGEPNLMLCLYGSPLLHLDITFDVPETAANRSPRIVVLWERERRLSGLLPKHKPPFPNPDPQWFEDRFWVWIQKAAVKAARGQLFETIEYLVHLRSKVLGPLALANAGLPPLGVRGIEAASPELANEWKATLALHDKVDCLRALHACVDLYRLYRPSEGYELHYRHEAEKEVKEFLTKLEER